MIFAFQSFRSGIHPSKGHSRATEDSDARVLRVARTCGTRAWTAPCPVLEGTSGGSLGLVSRSAASPAAPGPSARCTQRWPVWAVQTW